MNEMDTIFFHSNDTCRMVKWCHAVHDIDVVNVVESIHFVHSCKLLNHKTKCNHNTLYNNTCSFCIFIGRELCVIKVHTRG